MTGFIDGWVDRLFGKPEARTFLDPRLGILETNVRRPRPGTWCDWRGSLRLESQERVAFLSVGGNAEGPFQEALQTLNALVKDLEAITSLAKTELARRGVHEVAAALRLESIHQWDDADGSFNVQFALDGQPVPGAEVELSWSTAAASHRIVVRGAA